MGSSGWSNVFVLVLCKFHLFDSTLFLVGPTKTLKIKGFLVPSRKRVSLLNPRLPLWQLSRFDNRNSKRGNKCIFFHLGYYAMGVRFVFPLWAMFQGFVFIPHLWSVTYSRLDVADSAPSTTLPWEIFTSSLPPSPLFVLESSSVTFQGCKFFLFFFVFSGYSD